MKTKQNSKIKIQQRLLPALAGLVLICSASVTAAQDLEIANFDTGLDTFAGTSRLDPSDIVWDPLQDADANPSSGSMYITVPWTDSGEAYSDVQIAFGLFSILNPASEYVTFQAYVKIDTTNSFPSMDGGYAQYALWFSGGTNNSFYQVVGETPLIVTNGWQLVSVPLASVPNDYYTGVWFGFVSDGSKANTNTFACWLDKMSLTVPSLTNRPTLSLVKPPLGLTCLSSQAGGTYQRQIIGTVGGNYSWNTTTATLNTTTYSMNITNFPGVAYSGYEAHMYLLNGLQYGQVDANVDYNAENGVYLIVYDNGDGSASGDFRYKVNNAGGGENFTTLTNGSTDEYVYCAAGPLGKWSLTFNNNTNVTLTAPDGTTNGFSISGDDANIFQDPLYVYVGTRPNDNSRIGQSATFNQFTITGAAASINDHFTNLDLSTWLVSAADPNGIIVTTPDTKYWMTWPTPDAGFTNLFITDNLQKSIANSQWLALPTSATGWINVGGFERLNFINQSTLNTAFGYTPTNSFFGLYHP
jgi:hypothetical protein